MTECLFFRLLDDEDKAAMLEAAVSEVRRGGRPNPAVFTVDPGSFRQVPGSPFAYWVSERVRRLFVELPSFEGGARTARVGLQTSDDFRFVRAWWEVPADAVLTGSPETTQEEFRQQTFEGKRWAPFAKGGEYSPYYADVHLVVNWERDGEEIRGFTHAFIRNEDFYFRPGLTWPLRTTSGLSVRALPAGCIFGHKGPAAFLHPTDVTVFLGLMNSSIFAALVALQLGAADVAARSYEVGLIQRTPAPELSGRARNDVANLAAACSAIKIRQDTTNEVSHVFSLPAVLQAHGADLASRLSAWIGTTTAAERQLATQREQLNDTIMRLYSVNQEDRAAMENPLTARARGTFEPEREDDNENHAVDRGAPHLAKETLSHLLSYAVGCAFGRWDIRLATGERPLPDPPDPFAPLPVCSPGMLTGPDGLPAPQAPDGYPLRIDPDGILVDDPGPDGTSPHEDDIVHRVRDVLEVIWGPRAQAIEIEACNLLGLTDLRQYFRDPRRFFQDHIHRYSKSRRKAPIYWLLQSANKSYGLWLYYHRLNRDTVFKALRNYVEPKLNAEEERLRELKRRLGTETALPRHERSRLERAAERQEALAAELAAFKAALERVAAMGYDPDLNDGVLLNIAPLHEMVPWSEAKRYWEELCQGQYGWSTMSKNLRKAGLVKDG